MSRKDLDEKLAEARRIIEHSDEVTPELGGAAFWLLQEVDRLRAFEDRVQALLDMKRQVRDTLLKDYQYAYVNDLRARENELMHRIETLEGEMKVLEALLDG